jgi:hypothetical protein
MNPTDFANKIRQKYPGAYDKVPDYELTKRIIDKYPVYKSQVNLGKIGQYEQEASQAMAQAKEAEGKATLGHAITSTLIDPAVKFIASAVRSPVDIVRGLQGQAPLQDEITLPSGDKTQSIQAGFGKTAQDVIEGKVSPLAATAGVVGETVGGAGDVLGGEQAVKAGLRLAEPLNKVIASKISSSIGQKAAADALEVVSPQLTKKETEAAIAAGRGQGGGMFSKTTIEPNKRLLDVADASKGIVSKGISGAENVNNLRSAISSEAETLSQKVAKIKQPVSEKGVKTFLDAVEKPIEIASDATQSRKFDITKNALIKIIAKNEKTVGGLLKSRKEFDALVEKEFPTLHDRANAPFKNAITGMRNALNDAIESNLPDGFGYKESLRLQRLWYEAIDNISGKSTGEVGRTGLGAKATKFAKKHPVLTAGAAYAVGQKAVNTAKKITGQ